MIFFLFSALLVTYILIKNDKLNQNKALEARKRIEWQLFLLKRQETLVNQLPNIKEKSQIMTYNQLLEVSCKTNDKFEINHYVNYLNEVDILDKLKEIEKMELRK